MILWLAFVDLVRSALFSLAHVANGSIGAGILALSILVRIALLPMAVRLALRARDSAERLKALEPEFKRLRDRFEKDPARLWAETRALREQNGIRLTPKGSFANLLIQMPLGAAVYRVVAENASKAGRFLWMPDLARPDVFIASLAATGASMALLAGPAGGSNKSAAIVAAIVTAAMVWKLSAGVGLYWVGSSAVGIAQSLLVRRIVARRG